MQTSQASSSTAQTPKVRLWKLDLPARGTGLCTDSLENLENHLEGSKEHVVHVPSIEYGSRIPETTSEIVRNPHTHLVEVQNCGQRGRGTSQMGWEHASTHTAFKSTQKWLKRPTGEVSIAQNKLKLQKLTCWHKDLAHSRGRWSEEACGASQKC